MLSSIYPEREDDCAIEILSPLKTHDIHYEKYCKYLVPCHLLEFGPSAKPRGHY